MQPPHHHLRIDLDELKPHLVKRLGPEGSKKYFYYLHRFLSLKLSKVEFRKLCLSVLGRENIPLHNQLIRSILRNACSEKSIPPGSRKDEVSKHGAHIGGQEIPPDGYQKNGSHINMAQASSLSNGSEILPVSPRKAWSGFRDRRSGDCHSFFWPNKKATFAPQAIMENGDMNPSDIWRPIQQAEDENENLMSTLAKMLVARRAPDCSLHVYRKNQTELVFRDDANDASCRSALRATLGVPFSFGGSRRGLPPASGSRFIGTFENASLLDSHALRDRMEHIGVSQGLDRVPVDCANILNHGLDSYLKGIIRSCIKFVGARSDHGLTRNNADKHQSPMKLVNGVKPSLWYQMHEHKVLLPISMQNFRVAMELNPR